MKRHFFSHGAATVNVDEISHWHLADGVLRISMRNGEVVVLRPDPGKSARVIESALLRGLEAQ